MRQGAQQPEQSQWEIRHEPEAPNFPEVSGTSLPLLATVLAGFAVTIIVQLLLQPEVLEGPLTGVTVALIGFLLATLCFLSSTVFAINAQASNYLGFLDIGQEGARLLAIEDRGDWIRRVERRWRVYHVAAIYSFYGGLLLLLVGINLVVWFFAGTGVALPFLLAAVFALAVNVGVGLLAERLSRPGSRDGESG